MGSGGNKFNYTRNITNSKSSEDPCDGINIVTEVLAIKEPKETLVKYGIGNHLNVDLDPKGRVVLINEIGTLGTIAPPEIIQIMECLAIVR